MEKIDKVKCLTLISNHAEGGVKDATHTVIYSSTKTSWVKKVLDPHNQTPWKVLLSNILEKYGGDKFWYNTQYGLESLAHNFNLIWRDVILNHAKIHEILFTVTEEMLSQPPWFNPEIKIIIKLFLSALGQSGYIFYG